MTPQPDNEEMGMLPKSVKGVVYSVIRQFLLTVINANCSTRSRNRNENFPHFWKVDIYWKLLAQLTNHMISVDVPLDNNIQ